MQKKVNHCGKHLVTFALLVGVSCFSGGCTKLFKLNRSLFSFASQPSTRSPSSVVAPTVYKAYTGTDYKPIPTPPELGPSNFVFKDPTFGSRILRVTDQNILNGNSFFPTDAGFFRTFNANSTAIKLTGLSGDSYWLEFDPVAFKVGDGTNHPSLHALPNNVVNWEWSATDPNGIYFLNASAISKYNVQTAATTEIGRNPTGDKLAYMAVTVGRDE